VKKAGKDEFQLVVVKAPDSKTSDKYLSMPAGPMAGGSTAATYQPGKPFDLGMQLNIAVKHLQSQDLDDQNVSLLLI
jgi:hypothetical protein